VSVDPGDLDAALINLAVNARAAMPAGGTITISVSQVDVSADDVVHDGIYASIDVADTGVGMTDDVLRRIGEPFFTTRPAREGTGLGVSMIHAFVRQSGGALRVESRPGVGSSFRILLPVTSAPISKIDDEIEEGGLSDVPQPQGVLSRRRVAQLPK
jgi:signal transduction histidine kinase